MGCNLKSKKRLTRRSLPIPHGRGHGKLKNGTYFSKYDMGADLGGKRFLALTGPYRPLP
jgi:hypothetical protein